MPPRKVGVGSMATTSCPSSFKVSGLQTGSKSPPTRRSRRPKPPPPDPSGHHQHSAISPGFRRVRSKTMKPAPGGAFSDLVKGEAVSQQVDVANSELYHSGASPLRRAFVELAGLQVALFVAMRKESKLLGAFTIYRIENRAFSD